MKKIKFDELLEKFFDFLIYQPTLSFSNFPISIKILLIVRLVSISTVGNVFASSKSTKTRVHPTDFEPQTRGGGYNFEKKTTLEEKYVGKEEMWFVTVLRGRRLAFPGSFPHFFAFLFFRFIFTKSSYEIVAI